MKIPVSLTQGLFVLKKTAGAQPASALALALTLAFGMPMAQAQAPSTKTTAAAQQKPLTQQQTDLFIYVTRDNAGALRGLLNKGVDPNLRDEKGQTPMTLALQLGSLNAFNALMASDKTNVEFRNANDESPLMMAAIRGQLDAATRLIRQGAHVNKTGWTPLHYAASGTTEEQVVITQLLLEKYAFIDAESPNLTTPLMMAAQYGSMEVVALLMAEGADPLMKNQLGLTAVDFAQRSGRAALTEQLTAYTEQVRKRRAQSTPSKP